MQLVLFELVKELLVHPFHEVKCDGISCSWDEDFKTCNCILSPVRGNGLFRIHQGLYLDENLQYEISPIAKIDQPFIFIGFQGEMSAFNFLIYDWLKALAVSSHYIFCWLLLNQPDNIFISYSKREKLRWWLLLNNFGQLLPQIWDFNTHHRPYLNGPWIPVLDLRSSTPLILIEATKQLGCRKINILRSNSKLAFKIHRNIFQSEF